MKLGDAATEVAERMLARKMEDPKVEIEGMFFLYFDPQGMTGPMAGVRIIQGRVDLMFINNGFSSRASGIFRRVLESTSPHGVELLLQDLHDVPGIHVEYWDGGVGIEFSFP